ncbi:MAG: heavy-metal-associated domain-containing protein [Clostridia bacterium]|nr:heavy-metal-associated domain-containing protein [Clostridia bacterium]
MDAVKGVKKYEVRLDSADASVIYEEGKTTPEKIAEAISAIGFEARVK